MREEVEGRFLEVEEVVVDFLEGRGWTSESEDEPVVIARWRGVG